MTHADMPFTLKLRPIGNSLGVVLPKAVLAKLGMKGQPGETLVLRQCKTSDSLEISSEDPEFKKKLDALRWVLENHDDVLRELAK